MAELTIDRLYPHIAGSFLQRYRTRAMPDNEIKAVPGLVIRPVQGQKTYKNTLETPGPGKGAIMLMVDSAPTKVSRVSKFFPRGQADVPTSVNVPATVLSFRVPGGQVFQPESLTMKLGPSTLFEQNYRWFVAINGRDIMSINGQAFNGRTIENGAVLPLGFTRDEQMLVYGGSLIEVIVIALNGILANDTISAMIAGSLYGEE